MQGEVSAQSNSQPTHKSWEVGQGWGRQEKADPQRVGPFWDLSPCPWRGGSWLLLEYAISYFIRKGNYECPTNPHISGSSSQQHPLLFPPATQHSSRICFWADQGPISSSALKTSAGNNTLLALPYKGQPLTVLVIRGPSPLHRLQLPASTLPLEWGKRPLPIPSDLKLISVLWGWCLWGTLNYRMTHQKSRCYGGEPKCNHMRGSLKSALPPEPHSLPGLPTTPPPSLAGTHILKILSCICNNSGFFIIISNSSNTVIVIVVMVAVYLYINRRNCQVEDHEKCAP